MSAIYWFRKALRLHDNPALNRAVQTGLQIYPIFVLDPHFIRFSKISDLRWTFLFDSLQNLDQSLKSKGSRLFVLKGNPTEVIKEFVATHKCSHIFFQYDSQPYARERDQKLTKSLPIKTQIVHGHTLYDLRKHSHLPLPKTYSAFSKLLADLGKPQKPQKQPPSIKSDTQGDYELPKMEELNLKRVALKFKGGQQQALRRYQLKFKDTAWVAKFQKPETSPNSLEPSTTVLSPYLKFGCLSVRTMFWRLLQIEKSHKHSEPPVSLLGQLMWREYFYWNGYRTENYDRIQGNPICKQIQWNSDPQLLAAWTQARTGFPFIDACMRQLRQEGWIHHLARHAVACFLTRGDLYQSWTQGAKVFDQLLLDADWSLNNGNWMWLSCSAFFHQYFRVYSPIAFGKKTDKQGVFIRKYVPELRNYSEKYIYEPWKAPLDQQKKWDCVIGKDYPLPIVDHSQASQRNMSRMKQYFGKGRELEASQSSKGSRVKK